ncbi:excinuclease ABC subunit UvrC [Thalassobaculum litoreum]|uniref:UvrABC system protein C n=1 Tax=Thalassobaculum litoreum DSM 18839 TaxID=1123362 RepID=A0A8G2BHM6_9PROT|nr:excinuclease ABC subunit UvrC [Thalassobaculum litoreum]SDF28797.1 Excinuclease ABC subunit C [Thalassobaculum litoreum DSM 18839]
MTKSLEDPDISDPPSGTERARRGRKTVPDIERGVSVIRNQVRTLPNAPGVYRMLDENGDVLYVGKARSLKKRVVNYTHAAKLEHRIFRMVSETASMEIVRTHTEVEALLLESNMIKRLKPRFNVLLRDDKSFPHILLTGDHPYPQITKHRGARKRKGQYFGPFASAGSVNRTITALQRGFLLRNCTDSMFSNRQRPCLQYQIKRCSAPCVGYVSEAEYARQVEDATRFLTGQSNQIQREFAARMQEAAEQLEFETAAIYRNRIRALTAVQANQDINVEGLEEADVIAMYGEGGNTCIQVFFFRAGSNFGNRAYFPAHDKQTEPEDVLAAFIGQFYDDKVPPRLVLISQDIPEQDLIAEALSTRADRKVELSRPQRGGRRKLMDHALTNAREALGRRMAESASQRKLLEGVAAAFGLDTTPERIEVYDNSHIQGSNAVGAMIVAGPDGLMKSAYRKFNIRNVTGRESTAQEGLAEVEAGDDYAMMRQVLTRRFGRALKEDPDRTTGVWPDLILVDGGQGQLTVATEVFAELGIDDVAVVGVAKGPDRDAGRERFFMPGREPFLMERRDPVLYFLQRLRDEAHRFAIETHRAKRTKAIGANPLDEIAGIGAKRKKALMHHFGSARGVSRAGLGDLEAVEGISKAVARKVYDHFHEDG